MKIETAKQVEYLMHELQRVDDKLKDLERFSSIFYNPIGCFKCDITARVRRNDVIRTLDLNVIETKAIYEMLVDYFNVERNKLITQLEKL